MTNLTNLGQIFWFKSVNSGL